MIFGIGVDIVQVARMRQSLERKGEKFAHKILSPLELEEFKDSNQQANFLAKRFAAKEAFSKALGTGFSDGLIMSQITIAHNAVGRPVLKLTGRAHDLMGRYNIRHSHVSLSDEKEYVVAYVTLEGRIRHNH